MITFLSHYIVLVLLLFNDHQLYQWIITIFFLFQSRTQLNFKTPILHDKSFLLQNYSFLSEIFLNYYYQ